jgi:hypothetical protein
MVGSLLDRRYLHRTLLDSKIIPTFIAYVPERLGRSKALDSAADCLFSAASQFLRPPDEAKEKDLLRRYGSALFHLQGAIGDPVESMSAEVLGAVALLSSHEVCNDIPSFGRNVQSLTKRSAKNSSAYKRRTSRRGSITSEVCID